MGEVVISPAFFAFVGTLVTAHGADILTCRSASWVNGSGCSLGQHRGRTTWGLASFGRGGRFGDSAYFGRRSRRKEPGASPSGVDSARGNHRHDFDDAPLARGKVNRFPPLQHVLGGDGTRLPPNEREPTKKRVHEGAVPPCSWARQNTPVRLYYRRRVTYFLLAAADKDGSRGPAMARNNRSLYLAATNAHNHSRGRCWVPGHVVGGLAYPIGCFHSA